MVQQKIVMKVQMCCEKCRTMALKIAAVAKGVKQVSIEGEKDQVEVIGERIDSVTLTMSMRKKVGHADIVSIEEVKVEEVKVEEAVEEEKKPSDDPIPNAWTPSYYYVPCLQYPNPMHYLVVHEEPTNCSVM
ncbi:heavy metal-associated isoprenylated plant protein 41-like [Rosa rugosa]|uniref:heavy metal-associated isoprenylated plant protein 41-like n=1 Tax=Rosa rugosa TaxID=74645 RepID=UPI002B417796|nr:heavy metal-associated isoprenylated plant protein 41-like [Rosa rugosa]